MTAPVRLDLSHLGRDQVAMVEMLLAAESIPHAVDGDELIVDPGSEPAARRIVRTVEDRSDVHVAWFDPVPEPATTVGGIPVASPTARLAGWVIDTLLLRVAVLGVVAAGASVWTALTLEAVYWVLCTALSGRTLGKLLTGTRVVTDAGHEVGVLAAVARYAVPSAGTWLSTAVARSSASDTALALVGAASLGWLLLVYAPVLTGSLHRGVHDRASRTVVVVERRRGRPRT